MRVLKGALIACALLLAAADTAQAQASGSISGTVTGPSGSPVQNLWIYAYAASTGSYYSSAQTDGPGTFTFPALAPDTYWWLNRGAARQSTISGSTCEPSAASSRALG